MKFAGQSYLKDSVHSTSYKVSLENNLTSGVLVSLLSDGTVSKYTSENPILGVCGIIEQGTAQIIYKGYEVGVLVNEDISIGNELYPNSLGIFSTTCENIAGYVTALSQSQNLLSIDETGCVKESKAVFINFDAQSLNQHTSDKPSFRNGAKKLAAESKMKGGNNE